MASATGKAPSQVWTNSSIGLFAHQGSPEGHLDSSGKIAVDRDPTGLFSNRAWRARGDFALAAAGSDHELLLAKGRFGGRPLYYTIDHLSEASSPARG